jgi:hypothetical protein
MPSTSFGSPNPAPQPVCRAPTGSETLPPDEGGEALRVKNFTGQHTFQAPASDDFIRGLLPHGQLPATEAASVLRQFCSVLGTMAGAIKGVWQAAKPTVPGSRKTD